MSRDDSPEGGQSVQSVPMLTREAMKDTNGSRAAGGVQVSVNDAPEDPEWDAFVASVPGASYLQTSMWARVKAAAGLRAVRVVLRREGAIAAGGQLFIRDAMRLVRLGYIPLGPVLTQRDAPLAAEFLRALDATLLGERVSVLKLQPGEWVPGLERELREGGFAPSEVSVAPTWTVRIPLAGRSDEELLARMRASTRGNLRRGEKSRMRIESRGAAALPVLQEHLAATASRQGFTPYPLAYHQRLWDTFAAGAQARLLVAELDGDPLASAMLIGFGDTVVHKVGGWSGKPSKARPNELIHWSAMRWARDAGYAYYDLGGIRPEAVRALNELGDAARNDPKNGVAFFKLGLGGEIVEGPVPFDRTMPTLRGRALSAVVPRLQRRRAAVARLAGRTR